MIFNLPVISSTTKVNIMRNLIKRKSSKYTSDVKDHHFKINVNFEWR